MKPGVCSIAMLNYLAEDKSARANKHGGYDDDVLSQSYRITLR